mmetsp:Transcript_19905/g.24548  ORF Transcript_19905/g.24548 Transcript_19905/m.24548 type:complete len:324 (+) Transcript_19905:77-1048(+)
MNDIDDEKEIYQESFERASADLEILCAAYPTEISSSLKIIKDDGDLGNEYQQPTWFPLVFTLTLQNTMCSSSPLSKDAQSQFGANITMEFPKGYPTKKSLQVVSYRVSHSVKKEHIEEVVASVKEAASEAMSVYGGEECGFSCCAAAIDEWNKIMESEQQATHKVAYEQEKVYKNNSHNDDDIHWITAENTLIDRKSVFQAHLCVISSEEMVQRAVSKLIEGSSKIQRATHNMYAYRFTETLPDGKILLKHDNDNDGEDGAGSRLAQLIDMRKEDGVLILVSRWYGGIHLGPKRFAHITNVARELLVECHENGTLSTNIIEET